LLYEQTRGKILRYQPDTRVISVGAKPFFITRSVRVPIYAPNGGNFYSARVLPFRRAAGAYRLEVPFDAVFISLAHGCADLRRALIDGTKQEIAG
jgi:hypothetical protein